MSHVFLVPFLFILLSRAASQAPILARPLASQLVANNSAISSAFLVPPSSALLANLSTPAGAVRVPPSWSFSIGFSGTTFLPPPGGSQKLFFDAKLDSGETLPHWLVFSKDTITFDGVTPVQSHGIQTFDIVVSATSDTFSISSDSFTLIVAPHDLSVAEPLLTRNVTANNKFSLILDDWQGILVDGARVSTPSSLTAASQEDVSSNWTLADMTMTDVSNPPLSLTLDTTALPWLSFDSDSRTLTGTPPLSLAGSPGLHIPALVTLSYTSQPLIVSTNFTLLVLNSTFTIPTLPPLLTTPGSNITFSLTPFLTREKPNVSMITNATWLAFDNDTYMLHGEVPLNVTSSNIKVTFEARNEPTNAISRAQMAVNIGVGGDTKGRDPTDRALRNAGRNVSVVVSVVVGVLGGTILLACLLAVCRQYCAAREHVEGAYVIDQSAFDDGLGIRYKPSPEKDKAGLEKSEAEDSTHAVYLANGSNAVHLATSEPEHNKLVQAPSRMISKAAFFGAIRERFESDGSWRGNRFGTGSNYGNGKRPRKSKISKPMVLLSSSTSIREGFGFGDRRRERSGNFTIFGGGNHASSVNGKGSNYSNSHSASNVHTNHSPLRPPRPSISPSGGSPTGTSMLARDLLRSVSNPSHNPSSRSPGNNLAAHGSGSAPSLGTTSMNSQTGTGSGTQSTFATGDSARITNAAGEVPFRRPGFDGHRETLAERSLRQTGNPGITSSTGPVLPSLARTKANAADLSPPLKVQQAGTSKLSNDDRIPPPKIPPKAGARTVTPKMTATDMASTPANLNRSYLSTESGASLKTGPTTTAPLNSAPLSTRNTPAPSKTPSQASLTVPLSYRKVFSADKGGESDSSAEDVEQAVIQHATKRSSSETPTRQRQQGPPGKPRLVAFTHEKTPATSTQDARRNVSQKAVLQGEESDPEAEMRIGLEFVRQLGHSEPNNGIPQRAIPVADPTRTPSAEYYASNDSNGSIAGRTRVVAPMVITSHRNRHQAAYSAASTHDSFLSLIEQELVQNGDNSLPRILLGANEPFNFAAPLDRSTLAGSALEAKQADGSPLPEWLRFDKVECEFWGVPPKAGKGVKAETRVARVVVKIWEAEQNKVVGGCVIDVVGNME